LHCDAIILEDFFVVFNVKYLKYNNAYAATNTEEEKFRHVFLPFPVTGFETVIK